MSTAQRTTTTKLVAGAAAAAAVSALAVVALSGAADAGGPNPTAVGLTRDGRLANFSVLAPNKATRTGAIAGLTGDSRLVGIDYRPADGKLYGVGDSGGVYTVNPATARVTKVSQLTVALSGTRFDIDFNPAVDRLRIVSNDGQNLRHDVDGDLTTVDAPLNVDGTRVRGVLAAAYTNNDNSALSGTALYDINTTTDTLSLQVPANSGTLNLVGPIGTNALYDAGMDVYSRIDGSAGKTYSNTAYAVLRTAQVGLRLYSIDVTTGRATLIKNFPGNFAVVDLAVKPAAAPAPRPTGTPAPTGTPTGTPTATGTPTGTPTLPTLIPTTTGTTTGTTTATP